MFLNFARQITLHLLWLEFKIPQDTPYNVALSQHELPFLRLGADLLFDNNKCIISQSIYSLGFYSIITCMGCCLECFCIKYLNDTLSNIKTNNKYVQKAFKNIL